MPKILKLTYCPRYPSRPWGEKALCLLIKNKRSPSGLLYFFWRRERDSKITKADAEVIIVRAKRDKNSRPWGEKALCLLIKNKRSPSGLLYFFCGERGIRTPGTSQFNGFQDRRNRPLCHLSKNRVQRYYFFLIYARTFVFFCNYFPLIPSLGTNSSIFSMTREDLCGRR